MLPPALVTPARAALKVMGELRPSEWNSPLTVAGREGRAYKAIASTVDRYKPNLSGAIDQGIPQGPLPQSTAAMVDRYKPNVGSVPDRGVAQQLIEHISADPHMPNQSGYVPGSASRQTTLKVGGGPVVDQYMPNMSGIPDRGIPQGPLPQGYTVDRYMPNSGGMPTSATVTPAGGRIPYAAPTATAGAAAPTASTAASALSDADKALIAKKYPGLDPGKVERQLSQMGPLQPINQQRPPNTASQMQPIALQQAIHGTPDVASVPNGGSLHQPRVEIGAERVGRQSGLSKQAVRDTTGPIRGEAQGAAAGMPNKPMDRIVQTLIDMGPKGQGLPESARESYAAAGNSDKTRLQVQAYLDALRKVGFVAPTAMSASAMRDAILSRLRGGDGQQ